jgi:ATP-dependent protease HslVU (ClpYQ) ATPase subunit
MSAPKSACSMRSSALRKPERRATVFRKKLRANELDDKEIEIEAGRSRLRRCR